MHSRKIGKKHLGTQAELIASSWLLDQGFEVYRNVSPHGNVDIVAINPVDQSIMLIDVKTLNWYVNKKTGKVVTYVSDSEKNRFIRSKNIKILYVSPFDHSCAWSENLTTRPLP